MTTDASIVHRRVDLGFPTPVPRHWAPDPVLTRIADAFSLLFPAGERFFIEAVQHYRPRITDDALCRAVKGFAFQEAQHAKVHADYNRMLADQGLRVDWVGRSLEARLGFARRHLPARLQLLLTATAEHLTATMAEGLLGSMHDHFADADPRMRALYYWHAVEEVEHKAVAWDVYEQATGGGWLRRVVVQAWITAMISVNVAIAVAYMLYRDGRLFDLGMWRRSLPRLFGRGGFFTRMVRPYLRGFRPGFHPSQTATPPGFDAFVAAWRERPDALAATGQALTTA